MPTHTYTDVTKVLKELLKNPSTFEKSGAINFMEDVAKSKGLSPNLLMILIRVIESKKSSTCMKLKLMSCLIPNQCIPEEAFIRMTCLLSDFKIDLNLKVEILKWMISVYSFVETIVNFQYLYEIFLTLLEYEALRPHLCHLLYKMTKKEHITLRRMKYITTLLFKTEPQPCLAFLLMLYVKHCPEYPHYLIKKDFRYDFEPLGIYPSLIKGVHPSYRIHIFLTQYFLTDGTDEIPSVYSIVEEELDATTQIISETCTGIERSSDILPKANIVFEEIGEEFKILKKSADVKEILKSKFRRYFLTSNIPVMLKTSIYDYIMTSLHHNLSTFDFLHDSVETFYEIQDAFPAAADFTETLVEKWDGYSSLDTVTTMLSYQPICCFEKISYKMDLIRDKLLKASVSEKCHLFNCFSKMYQNWVLLEYNRYSVVPCDRNCACSDDSSSGSEQPIHLPIHEVYKLGNYIDIICNALILDDNVCLLNEILLHYERVSKVHMKVDNLVLHLPISAAFHAALFSLSSITLDNLCRLTLRYNAEIISMEEKNNPESLLAAQYFKLCSKDVLKIFCNESYGPNEKTHLSNTKVFQRLKQLYPEFEKLFILYRHPALLQKTYRFFEIKELNKIPLEIMNIPDVNSDFFKYLAKDGLEYFMKFITMLM